MLNIIVAMSENRVIGRDGQLPWRLPDDLKRFKSLTMGHHLIMGRRTFDSIGRPLPGRTTIVLTRDANWRAGGVLRAGTLDEALELVATDTQPFIVGGGELYEQFLPRVDRLYVTRVHATIEGDAYFPEIDSRQWDTLAEEHHAMDERHAYTFSFIDLMRVGASSPV